MKGRGTSRAVSPGKRTTVAQGSKLKEAFVPNWDKEMGHAAHDRMETRRGMGQKKTPIGAGKLK